MSLSEQFPIITIPEEVLEFSQDETMGSKPKFWFKDSDLGRCLFKYSRPRTGEDWAEKLAAELAELLGLAHARYELAETWNGDRGIVSPNCVPEGRTLIHGNEILTPRIPNYPTYETYRASQHTIGVVLQVIQDCQVVLPPEHTLPTGIRSAMDLFMGYLLLDAWIGNGDRHHENWGFIRCGSGKDEVLYLAPTYDHASSLGRELSDEQRQRRSVEAYATKCESAFYWEQADKKPLKTFDLFAAIADDYPDAANFWLSYLEGIPDEMISSIFERFPSTRLSAIAAEFAGKILAFNRNRLLSLK